MNLLWTIVSLNTSCYTKRKGCTAGRTTAATALILRRQNAPSNSVPQGEETGMEAEEKQDSASWL